jgi:hypothetical protein
MSSTIERRRRPGRPEGAMAEKAVPFSKLRLSIVTDSAAAPVQDEGGSHESSFGWRCYGSFRSYANPCRLLHRSGTVHETMQDVEERPAPGVGVVIGGVGFGVRTEAETRMRTECRESGGDTVIQERERPVERPAR